MSGRPVATTRPPVAVAAVALPVMGPGPREPEAVKYRLTAVLPLATSTAAVDPAVGKARDISTLVKRSRKMAVGGAAMAGAEEVTEPALGVAAAAAVASGVGERKTQTSLSLSPFFYPG